MSKKQRLQSDGPSVAVRSLAAGGAWRWRRSRWVLGLVGFWLIAGGGAGFLARSGSPDLQSSAGAFITAVLVVILVTAAATDRGSWSVALRFIWVIGLWLLHAAASVALLFVFAKAAYPAVDAGTLERSASVFAAFPLVVWAMRRSRLFVSRVRKATYSSGGRAKKGYSRAGPLA